jgi:ABC-type multidrug transport system fused ATPase/permease subunit
LNPRIITPALRALVPLWPFLRPQAGRVLRAESAGLAAALLDGALVVLLARFVEGAGGRGATEYGVAMGLVVLRALLSRAQAASQGEATARVRAALSSALHQRLLRVPLARLRAAGSGDLLARVFHDAPLAAAFALHVVPQAALQVVRAGVLLGIAARFDPVTAGLVLLAVLPLLLLARALGRRSARLHGELALRHGALFAATEDALAAPEALRAFRAAGAEQRRFDRLAQGVAEIEGRAARMTAASEPAAAAVGTLLLLALIARGHAVVAAGEQTLGALAAALAAGAAALISLRGLVGLHSHAQQGRIAALRVAELLAAELEPAADADREVAPAFSREIAFEAVTFEYPGRTPALSRVDLVLRRGERLALVGETGGGKTTLLRLLLRLEAPAAGRLTLDGIDAAAVPIGAWRALFGFVPQDAQLLSRSIEENLRLGRDSASAPEVEAAARAAGLGGLLARLPAGLATEIGAAGRQLSGGERLELALARALLGGPAVLVLDEVTASLDSLSERRALDAIRRASDGRTLLLVTHRLSTARLADRIVVLEGGRIVQSGRFEELVACEGTLRRLWEAQGRPGA